MTSAIDKNDFDFENIKYRPEISMPQSLPQIRADQMASYMSNNTLDSRSEPIPTSHYDQNKTVYRVDVLRVKIPSEIFREEKAKYWEEERSQARTWGWIEGGLTVAFAAGAFVLKANPYVAGALGVAAVASLLFSAMNFTYASKASHQIDGWKTNPLEKIAAERKKAFREGFTYVYRNDLKLQGSSNRQVLLPSEVQFLFERHFDEFYQKLLPRQPSSEQGKKEWLDQFTNYNPVSGKLLAYAYDGRVPDRYAQVSYDYEVLLTQLTDLRGEFTKLRNKREKETTKIIQGINQNRDLALLPFQGMLAYWELQAKTEKDKKLEELKKTCVGEEELKLFDESEPAKKVKDEYKSAVTKYQLYYAAAIIPVNAVFDKQVSDAKANLKDIMKEIKKNEASSHAPFFNYSWGLLDFARKIKQTPEFVYQHQVFNAEQSFHIPTPSAPQVVNINFVQQAQQQKPQGIDDSNYSEYLKFVSWQELKKKDENGTLYPNLNIPDKT